MVLGSCNSAADSRKSNIHSRSDSRRQRIMNGVDPITAIAGAFDDLFLLGEKLSPSINAWIEASIPARKQRIMTRRIKRCKRHARKATYRFEQIPALVRLDFADLSDSQQADIVSLIDFELFGK